ncbi:MAG: class I SAM-dependent methyltransferase, partial [Firmicutes bacterium]|nr:class I SAM-dependent methyltransferase [Bacillota bacterium]
ETAASNIARLGYSDRIRVEQGDGEEAVNRLIEAGEEPFDLVFIDAAKSHYKRFLEASLPLCRPGAIIVSDNVLIKGCTASDQYDPTGKFKTNIRKMREYLEFITHDERMDTTVMSCGDGLSISKLK